MKKNKKKAAAPKKPPLTQALAEALGPHNEHMAPMIAKEGKDTPAPVPAIWKTGEGLKPTPGGVPVVLNKEYLKLTKDDLIEQIRVRDTLLEKRDVIVQHQANELLGLRQKFEAVTAREQKLVVECEDYRKTIKGMYLRIARLIGRVLHWTNYISALQQSAATITACEQNPVELPDEVALLKAEKLHYRRSLQLILSVSTNDPEAQPQEIDRGGMEEKRDSVFPWENAQAEAAMRGTLSPGYPDVSRECVVGSYPGAILNQQPRR